MFVKVIEPKDPTILKVTEILKQASQAIMTIYESYCNHQSVSIHIKSDDSPVTEADIASHNIITSFLKTWTPNIPILSEEGINEQRKDWKEFWLLDPLDGTKEFLAKRDEFTINLSHVVAGKTSFAAIMAPVYEVIYIASIDGTVFKYSYKTQEWFHFSSSEEAEKSYLKIAVSQGKKKSNTRIGVYQTYFDEIAKKNAVEIIGCGSAYKFCLMLEEKLDIYPRFHPTSEWDTSAGQYLLECIGGGLLNLQQYPFTYNQRSTLLNGSFIAFRAHRLAEIAFSALDTLQE